MIFYYIKESIKVWLKSDKYMIYENRANSYNYLSLDENQADDFIKTNINIDQYVNPVTGDSMVGGSYTDCNGNPSGSNWSGY